MLTKKQFIKSQKECADMLGRTLQEYNKYCQKLKAPKSQKKINNIKYNNIMLKSLGLKREDLKNSSRG